MAIKLSWQSILEKFKKQFDAIYFPRNKQKLYFSFDEHVEGAKDTWMLLAFTDGLLQSLEPTLCGGIILFKYICLFYKLFIHNNTSYNRYQSHRGKEFSVRNNLSRCVFVNVYLKLFSVTTLYQLLRVMKNAVLKSTLLSTIVQYVCYLQYIYIHYKSSLYFSYMYISTHQDWLSVDNLRDKLLSLIGDFVENCH